jgi:CRP-like cAMP-binding protein
MTPHKIVDEFFAKYPERTYQKGQTVLLPDPVAVPFITYIKEGAILQYDITEAGDKVVLNIFKPGAFWPASCAINKTPNVYFFEAAVDCTVRQAPAKDVAAFLENEPAVTFDLLQRVYRGTDGLLGRLAGLLGGDAQRRVLYEIQINARRFGKKTDDGVEIKITEEVLAQQTGLARETISRELKKLRQKNMLTQRRGVIEIKKEFVI